MIANEYQAQKETLYWKARRWWLRKTVKRGPADGCLFQHVTVRLSPLDRILVALGRNIIVETRSEHDAPPAAMEPFGEMTNAAWTEPRRWSR